MEYLAPPLNAVLQVQLKIKSGLSARSAIKVYVQNFPNCSFAKQVRNWLFCQQTNQPFSDPKLSKKIYRKTVLNIFERGLKGEPILQILQEFQRELKEVSVRHLDQQIQKLPFLTLIPLFLLQVPAFLLLLLAPLLLDLSRQVM